MNTTANPVLAVDAIPREHRPVAAIHTLAWKQALLLALGAVAAFHLAYVLPSLSCLIVVYLYCLYELAALPTPRKAFYIGLTIGYAVYAPHLTFFWTIFGWPAIALWTVLAFWLGLFVALARLCRVRFGRLAVLLVPFVWTGLEYFRSELYYLRFSWLSVGYAFNESPHVFTLTSLGVYGIGFCLTTVLAILAVLTPRRHWRSVFGFVALLGVFANIRFASDQSKAGKMVRIIGLQLEYPYEADLLAGLNQLATQNKDAELVVLSEYTLQRPPSEQLKEWCRRNKRYLIVGGKDFVSDSAFYNTVFVLNPNGEVVFRQAKSVPIQFFSDGLPAATQQLWESPWGKIGFCICYDGSYQRVTARLVKLGAQAIINPSADETSWGQIEHLLHARIAPTRAAEHRVPVFKVACTGISQLVDRSGRVTTSAPYPGQGETIAGEMALAHPGRLPLDHWLGPLSVLVTGAVILWLLVEAFFRKIF
jgi:apolipoprotein N-acyltransferase